MDILWLGETSTNDLALMGGKAGQLSGLARSYRVPPGFCLTTAAYANAIDEPCGCIPSSSRLYRQVQEAYGRLAERSEESEPAVAVRSSAVDEDGEAASFAGQHETFLNVRGADCVAEAVVSCWESARSDRALTYRRTQGLTGSSISLAVLVQQMVMSDVSAVAFSANPITGSRSELVINATWGLGESLVGGTVTPDTYTVDRDTWTVSVREIAEKQRMTVATAGGTGEVQVPTLLRRKAVLDDARTLEIAALALDLERRLGRAVDVECAYREGRLYLLQCRPITTLNRL